MCLFEHMVTLLTGASPGLKSDSACLLIQRAYKRLHHLKIVTSEGAYIFLPQGRIRNAFECFISAQKRLTSNVKLSVSMAT